MRSQQSRLPEPDRLTQPQLTIRNDSGQIRISSLDVDVVVMGNIATTTYDMTFYNPVPRVLEGELNFPLKANQQIVHFAMDVNGKLREGVIVEKHKGRKVFESIVREGIDPGLLEKIKGNNFRARVYPLLANGSKRIIITCQEEMTAKDEQYNYLLPLHYSSMIEDFSLRLEVVKSPHKPKVIQNDFARMQFNRWRDSYVTEIKHQKISPNGLLAVALPVSEKKTPVFLSKNKDTTYFYAVVPIKLARQAKQPVKHIHLLWDVSGSRFESHIKQELKLLGAYFQHVKNTKVTFSILNHKRLTMGNFSIRDGQWDALRKTILRLKYDGGSRMDNLDLSQLPGDEIMFVSDGLASLGDLTDTKPNKPVITINSSVKANHALLQQLADESGGTYVNLTSQTADKAIELLKFQRLYVSSLHTTEGVTNRIFTSLTPDERQLIVTGQLISSSAQIAIEVNNVREQQQINLSLTTDDVQPDLPAPRLWAMHQIDKWLVRKEQNKAAIINLSQKFGIVTDYTSLMVLDRLEDYIRFEIDPPAELRAQYDEWMSNRKSQQHEQIKQQQNEFSSWISSYKKWWATNYPLTPQPPQKKHVHAEEMPPPLRERSVNSDFELPPPPPPTTSDVLEIVEDELEIEDSEMDEVVPFYCIEDEDNDHPIPHEPGFNRRRNRMKTTNLATPWDSTALYIKTINKLPDDEIYNYYLSVKKQHTHQPSFFLDIATYLFDKGRKSEAVSVITNLTELQLENAEILRIAGHQLVQQGETELAIQVFQSILTMRPEELQSYRDLALALEQAQYYQQALNLYIQALEIKPDGRFNGIRAILLNEMNNLLDRQGDKLDQSGVNEQWRYSLPVDMRIVLSWSSDNSDVDLWILEPSGEKCFYSYNRTWLGGRLSRDIRQGYGPEEYIIKKAVSGTYQIKAHYYGDHRQTIAGPIILKAEIFQHYGTPNQTSRKVVVQLKERKQVIDLGEVIVK